MKLREFLARFQDLGDQAFLTNFAHPFLLEQGRVLRSGPSDDARDVYLLRAPAGRSLVAGRGRRCDLALRDQRTSAQHAAFVPPSRPGEPWTVIDTGSTNGTWVEDERLRPGEPTPLHDLSAISFGAEAHFTFLTSQSFLTVLRQMAGGAGKPAEAPLPDQTDPQLVAISADGLPPDDVEPEPVGVGPLLLCCPPFDPLPLAVGQRVVIGRAANADLVIPGGQVSRYHAELTRGDEGVFVRDLGSANGTFVGSSQVGPHPLELLVGKTLRIGEHELVLEGPREAVGRTALQQLPPGAARAQEGRLEDTDLLELFRQVELGTLTGAIELDDGRGLRGRITFRVGQPFAAETELGEQGLVAARRLLGLTQGEYRLRIGAHRVSGPRTIELAFSELALDAFLGEA